MVEMDLALGTGYHLEGENSHLINAGKEIMEALRDKSAFQMF